MHLSIRARLILAFAALALLAAGGAVWLTCSPAQGRIAHVYQDGVLVAEIELSFVNTPYLLPIGAGNQLWVSADGVRMESADCPDQSCVRQGPARIGWPLICLPNRIVVRLEWEGSDEYDAILR